MELAIKNADQIGIVVEDLDKFLKNMDELLGLDDFEVIDYPPEGMDPQTTYHDQPAEFTARIAFRDFDKFQMEVIQPVEGQSIFQDHLDQRGPGLHHIRFTQPNFDEARQKLVSKGISCISSGRGAHGSSLWAYFDTSDWLEGLLVELRKLPT
jgi:hypothetical protein